MKEIKIIYWVKLPSYPAVKKENLHKPMRGQRGLAVEGAVASHHSRVSGLPASQQEQRTRVCESGGAVQVLRSIDGRSAALNRGVPFPALHYKKGRAVDSSILSACVFPLQTPCAPDCAAVGSAFAGFVLFCLCLNRGCPGMCAVSTCTAVTR